MAQRRRGNPLPGTAAATRPRRFVAVAWDVVVLLDEWRQPGSAFRHFLAKVAVFMDSLTRGDEAAVRQFQSILDSCKVAGAEGVYELRPGKKGGAPRLFYVRKDRGTFFVAAGIEKSNVGVKEIDTAIRRASQLRGQRTPDTDQAVVSLWSADFDLTFGGVPA